MTELLCHDLAIILVRYLLARASAELKRHGRCLVEDPQKWPHVSPQVLSKPQTKRDLPSIRSIFGYHLFGNYYVGPVSVPFEGRKGVGTHEDRFFRGGIYWALQGMAGSQEVA